MQHFGQVDERGLARPVAQRLGQAPVASHAGHEGDAAAGRQVVPHAGQQPQRTVEVDVQHALGGGEVEAVGAHGHVVARQVQHQIDAAPGGQQLSAGAVQAGAVGGIAGQQQGVG